MICIAKIHLGTCERVSFVCVLYGRMLCWCFRVFILHLSGKNFENIFLSKTILILELVDIKLDNKLMLWFIWFISGHNLPEVVPDIIFLYKMSVK